MKKFSVILMIASCAAAVVGCDEKEPEIVDFPVVGNLNISGRYVTYLHGSQGWIEEDRIGVFVTSDGVEQVNLPYVPSEVCPAEPNEYVEGYYQYDEEKYQDGDILLTPEGQAAGFKQGEHNIYAYVPYAEGNTSHTAVKLPKTDNQEYFNFDGIRYFNPEYNFAYARLAEPVTEYSSATHSLGDFVSPFVQMTVPSPTFPDALEGKTITKVTISADKNIATTDAVINLETGEVTGTLSKSIEIVFPDGVTLEKGYFGITMETLYIVMCIDFDEALQTEFSFTYTIDGSDYTISGTPNSSMSSDGNVNMYEALEFTE